MLTGIDDILGSGLDHNNGFREICAEKPGIVRCKLVKTACDSVCLTMKSILLLNSSHNNSSIDDVPSQ